MRLFAILVFGLHTVAETIFGLNGFIAGASSALSAEEVAAQSAQMTISARFAASGLLAFAVFGALVLFGPGVQSATGRIVALGLAVFHSLGVLGIVVTAVSAPDVLSTTFTAGALGLHGLLALGFGIVLIGLKPAGVRA